MSKKILIVDDDMINLMLLKKMLTKNSDYEVLEAKNGLEALKILEDNHVDMVLLDIIMPVMDGLQVIENLRGQNRYIDIPIVVLSTNEMKKKEALELGANDFMEKPIREDDLMQKVRLYTDV
jgi:putative two-component system response regulator